MSELAKIVRGIQGLTATVKFNNLIERAAKEAGLPVEEFAEKKLKKKIEALMKKLPTDQVKALQMYKKAVGPEMWEDIKNNPSLPEMVETWRKAEVEKVVPDLLQIIKTVLPADHDMTDDDIKLVLDTMTEAAG
jgi:antitoxin component of RelBE/YafQ-DinJ toxin-antitoxin module